MQIPRSVVAPILIVTVLAVAWPGLTEETKAEEVRPVVLMQTSLGPIKIELWYDKAPVTTASSASAAVLNVSCPKATI